MTTFIVHKKLIAFSQQLSENQNVMILNSKGSNIFLM